MIGKQVMLCFTILRFVVFVTMNMLRYVFLLHIVSAYQSVLGPPAYARPFFDYVVEETGMKDIFAMQTCSVSKLNTIFTCVVETLKFKKLNKQIALKLSLMLMLV